MLNILSYKNHSPFPRAAEGPTKRHQAPPSTPGDSFQPSPSVLVEVAPTSRPTAGFSAEQAVAAATQLLNFDPPKGPAVVDIKNVQAQLSKELPDVKVDYLHTDKFGALNGRLATAEELGLMIESLKDESKIPFGYITDGCYARAHLMDESFRQHGINYAKMFVRGDLAAKNEHMEARWWYHVAPLVFMDDGQGNPVAKIIDPGFSDKPLDPDDWVKAMNQGPSIQVDFVDPEQYYPRRSEKPESFSESLPPAVSRMQSYAKKLHNHRKSQGEQVGDFVKPSWEEAGSGGDFIIGGERKTLFPEGVKTAPTRVYYGVNDNKGILLEVEPVQEDAEVSAVWENRPKDFDPYAW